MSLVGWAKCPRIWPVWDRILACHRSGSKGRESISMSYPPLLFFYIFWKTTLPPPFFLLKINVFQQTVDVIQVSLSINIWLMKKLEVKSFVQIKFLFLFPGIGKVFWRIGSEYLKLKKYSCCIYFRLNVFNLLSYLLFVGREGLLGCKLLKFYKHIFEFVGLN